MDSLTYADTAITFYVSADENLVENVVHETEKFISKHSRSGYYDLLVIASEMLVNAKYRPNRHFPDTARDLCPDFAFSVELVGSDTYRVELSRHGSDQRSPAGCSGRTGMFRMRPYSYTLLNTLANKLEIDVRERKITAYGQLKHPFVHCVS